MRRAPRLAIASVLALAGLCAATPALARPRVYAVVVAQNRSLDAGVRPLRYADDDGVKTWELLGLWADEASLFVVPDEETARQHPDAVHKAEVPERAAIVARLRAYDQKMEADLARGDEPELFFFYAGHGDVDAAGQGYVNLHDGRLTRADLFREVIAPSKAKFVHVIIDACKSYFMVNSRGSKWVDDRVPETQDRSDQKVRAFLAEEQLEQYPRAGVIVATSGDQETHEWGRYQGGILSHELRSALSGAGDVNGDGRIEYSELRAFLAAANARVRNPAARVDVFARPPALDRHRPIVDLRAAAASAGGTRFLHFAAGLAGRFHLEDERGVRWADLHKDAFTAFDVVVPARGTFWLRRGITLGGTFVDDGEEATVGGGRRVEVARLAWHTRAVASRGAVEESFRQDLYQVPYGRGFYDGFVATSGDVGVEDGGTLVIAEARRADTHRLQAAYLFTGAPAGGAAFSHGVDVRYGARVARIVELGVAAQVGQSTGGANESLTRAALLGTLGIEWLPLAWLSLRADAALGWQLLSGQVVLGTTRVDGVEGKGLRAEVTGGLGFRAVGVGASSSLWVLLRGGVAIDGVFPTTVASSTRASGLFALGLQLRL